MVSLINTNEIVPINLSLANYVISDYWINFYGAGTVGVRNGTGGSSIIDLGIGQYSVNYGSIRVTTNYAIASGGCRNNASIVESTMQLSTFAKATTSCSVYSYDNNNGNNNDADVVTLLITV